MVSRWIRAVCLLALAPATALAFEAVDTIVLPMRGAGFDAYMPDPLYPVNVWAQAGAMWDSNPFGVRDGANLRDTLHSDQKSDFITRFGVGANYMQKIYGRQSIRLGARADAFKWFHFNEMDNIGYGIAADWLWEITNDLSGTVGYGRTRGLADPSEAQTVSKDYITTDRIFALGAWRVGPNFRLRGDVSREKGDRSGDRPGADTESNTLIVGADYISPLANTIGVQWRETRGQAPTTPTVDPSGLLDTEYTEHEVGIVGSYNLGAQLRVSGLVGRSERTYKELPVEPFDGPVWRARVDWLPGYKTIMTFETYRATRAVLDVDATHVVVRGASFGPQWAPTAKIVLSARVLQERRQYQQTNVTGLPARDETVRLLRFGVGWEPRRHYSLNSAIEYGERTSNQLGRDFNHVALMTNFRYDW